MAEKKRCPICNGRGNTCEEDDHGSFLECYVCHGKGKISAALREWLTAKSKEIYRIDDEIEKVFGDKKAELQRKIDSLEDEEEDFASRLVEAWAKQNPMPKE